MDLGLSNGRHWLIWLVALSLWTIGCKGRSLPETDLDQAPQRLVSLLPSATEAIFTVGAGDRLVGVTLNDDFPEQVKTLEKVGDQNVDYEKVLALSPDLVILDSTLNDDGPRLESLGLEVLDLKGKRLVDISRNLQRLSAFLDCGPKGVEAQRDFERALAEVEPLKRSREVFVEVWGSPLMTVGSESLPNDLLTHLNLKNIYGDELGYFQVNSEDLLSRRPDFILVVAAQDLDSKSGKAQPDSASAKLYSQTGRQVPVVFISGDLLTKPTVRVLEGLKLLKDAAENLD